MEWNAIYVQYTHGELIQTDYAWMLNSKSQFIKTKQNKTKKNKTKQNKNKQKQKQTNKKKTLFTPQLRMCINVLMEVFETKYEKNGLFAL